MARNLLVRVGRERGAVAGAPCARAPDSREDGRMGNRICIGRSMRIDGELTGSEDLVIDGTVEGKIVVSGHQLTIGEHGKVSAEIRGASAVIVRGEMIGNITAGDSIEIGSTGSVHGDLSAPRVILSEGARFRGSIDMHAQRVARAAPAPPGAKSPIGR